LGGIAPRGASTEEKEGVTNSGKKTVSSEAKTERRGAKKSREWKTSNPNQTKAGYKTVCASWNPPSRVIRRF